MLTDYAHWSLFSGGSIGGVPADQASIDSICGQVDAAIKRLCRLWLFEPQTFTNIILDAPLDDVLELPQLPVRSITSLYANLYAGGDPSQFTSEFLLTNYTDYLLEIDDPINGYSKTGFVRRRNGIGWSGRSWGGERRWPQERLAGEIVPSRGSIMVSFAAGCLTVPDDVQLAANLAVSMIYQRRVLGMPVSSNSWNGESVSFAGPFLDGVFQSPDIAALLSGYRGVFFAKA